MGNARPDRQLAACPCIVFSFALDLITVSEPDPSAFGPKTLRILSRAYKVALGSIRQSDQRVMPDLKNTIAKGIVDQAQKGERNPFRLALIALRGLTKRK